MDTPAPIDRQGPSEARLIMVLLAASEELIATSCNTILSRISMRTNLITGFSLLSLSSPDFGLDLQYRITGGPRISC